jgi:hypothetical protein
LACGGLSAIGTGAEGVQTLFFDPIFAYPGELREYRAKATIGVPKGSVR